jgi:IS5 family transposase
MTDRRGTPLAVRPTGANIHDSTMLGEMLDAIPPIARKSGRPRRRPDKCHADKGYDYPRCRNDCRTRGIAPRIARRGVESREKLGWHRWVVERSFAWFNRFRRLTIRYEWRSDIHCALTSFACSLSCLRVCPKSCAFLAELSEHEAD